MQFVAGILNKNEDNELVAFLDNLGKEEEQVLGYHYPFYRNMLESIGLGSPLYIGLRNEDGKLSAVMPGFIKESDNERVYSSLPFFGPNGGVICSVKDVNIEIIHREVLNFLFAYLAKQNIVSASVYSPFNQPQMVELYTKLMGDSVRVNKFTSFIPLTHFELSNDHVESSALRNMRKALKSGVSIKETVTREEMDTIYEIYTQNCADYGIPMKPKETLLFLLNDEEAKKYTKIYIAEFEGKMIGALLMINSPSTASYYIPCNVHEFRNLQPNACLIAHALEDAKKSGKKFWNWESSPSKESGVYIFKKKWGSVDSDYSIFIKPFRNQDYFAAIGQAEIAKRFPYYFVYPFNLLQKA
jgi:hypothetical protein